MRDSVREGVESLFAEAGLDPDQYRFFSTRRCPAFPDTSAARTQPASGVMALTAARPVSPAVQSPVAVMPRPASPAGGWAALEAFLPGPERAALRRPQATRADSQQQTVCVVPLAGGVGATTVAGALARMLASAGERVGLVDGGDGALIGRYAGLAPSTNADSGNTDSDGLFPIPGDPVAPPVRLLHGGSAAPAFGFPDAATEDLCWPRLEQWPGAVDRVLVDGGSPLGSDTRRWALGASRWLAVLHADLRCVLRIPRLLEFAAVQGRQCGHPISVHLLLNAFDPASPVQAEIRDRLRQRYGGLLAPVAIRRSELINEALARGEALADRDPKSDVAADIAELARWLRGTDSSTTRGELQS